MAPELSSNWKKLQAKIKAEPSKPVLKRKADEQVNSSPPHKKSKPSKEATSGAGSKSELWSSHTVKRGPHPSSSSAAPRTSKSRPPKAVNTKMGAAASHLAAPKSGITPSLALWASDNDIPLEDIAQAYHLGTQGSLPSLLSASSSTSSPSITTTPNTGLTPSLSPGKFVAIDCEMVGVGPGGHESALARASVVDFHGRQLYDSFVKPQERVTDWRTAVSGVSPRDMRFAREFAEVQRDVAALLEGRVLVGHDVRHDLAALMLEHPLKLTRDTARHEGFKKFGHGRKPALRVLAKELLGVDIQMGQHSSVEDARVAMLLYRRDKSAFDTSHAARFPDMTPGAGKTKPPGPKKTKKNKKKKH